MTTLTNICLQQENILKQNAIIRTNIFLPAKTWNMDR